MESHTSRRGSSPSTRVIKQQLQRVKVSMPRPSRNINSSKQTVIVNVCMSKVQSMFSVPMATICYHSNKQLEEVSSLAAAQCALQFAGTGNKAQWK